MIAVEAATLLVRRDADCVGGWGYVKCRLVLISMCLSYTAYCALFRLFGVAVLRTEVDCGEAPYRTI